MHVCLFEDQGWINLEPLSLWRPVFDLLCGQTPLAAKQCRHFAPCEIGVLVRPQLAPLYRLHHPRTPVNDSAWLAREPVVMVNGRWLPPPDPVINLGGPCVALVADQLAYAVVGPDLLAGCSVDTIDEIVETWKQTLPQQQAGGSLIGHLWDLVAVNGEQIAIDCRHHLAGGHRHRPPSSFATIGPADQLRIDPTAQIDPLVVADTRNGPVVIDAGAIVHAFSRLEGPCWIGPRTQVLGGKIRAGTSLGPCSRVGGEVEASIVQGYSNKYHDGFLGHSFIGEWVNLGAGTQTSDLRNDYGEVKVTVNGRPVPTGRNKVGSFIGDHTKIGLGALLNTGSNIGTFCNVLPSAGYVSRWVPSFASWWNGSLADLAGLKQLQQTAQNAMHRRGWAFSTVHADLMHELHRQTAPQRRQAILQAEQRQLRRSA